MEDQEAAALVAEASVEAVALAEADLAEADLAEAAVTEDLAARIITGTIMDITTTITTARDFSFLDRGTITTAADIMAGAAVLARSSVYS